MVSVMLLPVGKVALAAPAQQSRRIMTSEMDLSRRVWMADHLLTWLVIGVTNRDVWTYCSQGDPGRRFLMMVRRESSKEAMESNTYAHQVLCRDSSIRA
jgi:hypothetical protein